MRLTRLQMEALKKLYDRQPLGISYLNFRRSAYIAFGDCVMVRWLNMTIGIEADGYTHS